MEKTMRSYRLAEKIMKYSENKAPYEDVLEKACDFCKRHPFRLSDLFSHVGDDYAARCIASGIIGKRLY